MKKVLLLFKVLEFCYLFSIILPQTVFIFLFHPRVSSGSCDSDLTVGDLTIKALKTCKLGIITLVHNK